MKPKAKFCDACKFAVFTLRQRFCNLYSRNLNKSIKQLAYCIKRKGFEKK